MSEIMQKTGKKRLGRVQSRDKNGQKPFRSFGIKNCIGIDVRGKQTIAGV